MKNIVYRGQKVGVISLGCSRNTVDSEKLLSEAKSMGARICPPGEAAIVLVNTCAFTQDAKKESIGVINDLIERKKAGLIKKIVVCGCLSERYKGELENNLTEVDSFEGVAGFKKDFDKETRLGSKYTAYLKISEGCANICSYCAIPAIKGKLASRPKDQILQEAKQLQDSGVKELVVIGQDITLYGYEKGYKNSLIKLLETLLKNTDIPWIRLLYLHPKRVNKDLLTLIASQKRILPYIDMPLQHINDRILNLMNRGVKKKYILSVIDNIRKYLPENSIRTTFITGFPSETEKEFEELCAFVKDVKFDKLGAFLYSREEGTRAYDFKKQIHQKTKKRRYDILMSLQKDISQQLLKEKRGRFLQAIVEEETQDKGIYLARTIFDAPDVDGILFLRSSKKLAKGQIVNTLIKDSYEYDLAGDFVL